MNIQELEWKYVKKYSGKNLLGELEKESGLALPESYKTMAEKHNGGRPNKRIFGSGDGALPLRSFLRVDETEDASSAAFAHERVKKINNKLFPFADDSFGNYFCLFPSNDSSEPVVVFLDMELEKMTELSESFSSFMNSLS
jgi:hypothetical protein